LSMELNEFLTRKQKIDALLREQGLVVGNRAKIITEVDTKQSDFRSQNYKTVSETLRNDLESKYVDYLQLDTFGSPIAIVEAKRTSKDPTCGHSKRRSTALNFILPRMFCRRRLIKAKVRLSSSSRIFWGYTKFPEPEKRIKDAFETYIIENNRHYSADQLNFIRTVQTVFTKKKHIEFPQLFDAPFTNFGVNAPMPMFTESELNDFINLCGTIEKEIYAEV
jgi:type I site-specific restriction endonuclease